MNTRIASAQVGVWQIPRVHENECKKDWLCPYSEPTLVTLPEKGVVCQVIPV